MKKKRRWRWVTRDKYDGTIYVHSHAKKPTLDLGAWFSDAGACADFYSHADFAAIFGVDISPGACVRVEFADAKILEGRS